MSGPHLVLVVSDDEALVGRIAAELAVAEIEVRRSSGASRDLDAACVIAVGDRLDAGPPPGGAARPPIVLLAPAPSAPEVVAALRSRQLAGVLGLDPRPGELLSAVLAAIDATAAHRSAERERRAAARRVESVAALGDISVHLTELGSYQDVVMAVTRELHRVVELDLAAAVVDPGDVAPILSLHSSNPSDASLVRAVRDRCLEALRDASGHAVDEDQLVVCLTGHPVLTAGFRSLPSSLEMPITIDGRPHGVVFVARSGVTCFSTDDRAALGMVAARLGDALRRLRARLGDNRRRLGLAVEAMADGLILSDRSSDEVLINPAARGMLGLDDDGPVTQAFLKEKLGFYPFDLIATSAEVTGPLREEVRVNEKILHSIISPVRDPGGKLEGVAVVLRDFTEAKALARRQAEFVSVVSHELRSPLTSITGALDLAVSDYAGRLSDRQRRYLEMAREGCVRLNQIVDDLVDMARSERGKMAVQLTPLLLDDQAREVVERFRSAALAKKIRLALRTESGSIRIVGDPDRLTQVLNNLLSNALKFTPAEGAIEVEVFGPSVSSSHVGVSVFNNGAPIPDDARERIFDKFERLDGPSTRQVGGTGLGLSISRAIIEAHGGRIWTESRPDGAKFVFTLPAAPDAAVPAEPSQAAGPAAVAAPGATVLVIDDDQYSSYIVKGILMGDGHEVLMAETADDALAIARGQHPSLVVVNYGLRASDPNALIGILKHDPDTRRAAVLAVSSSGERPEALRAGADDVTVKPIDPAALREQSTRLIAEAGRSRAYRILTVDDDNNIRTICREVLAAAGYTVREASSGAAALAEARRYKPDLILMDVMMPGMDGFQVAEHLRSDSSTSMIPIIFLSARGETADKVRAFRVGAEDYVVKPFVSAELVARVRKALERRERELGASPTTQLPGANTIEAEIERRLGETPEAAYCYLDLDNLKSFNDYYGYARADGVIRQTADLLRDVLASEGTPGDFLGHIAGDDFVFITTDVAVDRVCATLCSAFDRLIPLYYNKHDREQGYIEALDRFGVMRRFPLMSISLAVVTAAGSELSSFAQLAEAAANGKKLAKGVVGSSYVRDGQVVDVAALTAES